MNDPELSAMSKIVETLEALSPADRRQVLRWTMPTTDVEVRTTLTLTTLLEPLNTPQRERVIRWTTARFALPKTVKTGRPKNSVRTAVAA
jgi:hypothetical protein